MSNNKKLLYVIGGIIGFVLFIVVAVVIIVSNEKIMYGEKYYDEYNNQYFLFKSDGTCEGSSNIVDCNYVLDSATLVVTTHIDSQGVLDYNPEYIYEFEIVEKNKIKRVKMTMFGYESTDGMEYSFDMSGDYIFLTRETKYLNGNLFDDEVLNICFKLTDEVDEETDKPLKVQMDNIDNLYEV